MANTTVFTKSLATAASANNIAQSQSPGAAAFTLNGSAVTSGVATIDAATSTNSAIGRRVIVTSAGNNSGINFLVTGKNASGNLVTDTFAGTNTGAAQSNLDFVTVTNVIGSAAVTGAVTVGTNGIGSSEWCTWNYMGNPPMNLAWVVELVSGAVNFTVQYTYDDPNGGSVPLAVDTASGALATTSDGSILTPVIATRVLINSGTGVIKMRVVEAGIG